MTGHGDGHARVHAARAARRCTRRCALRSVRVLCDRVGGALRGYARSRRIATESGRDPQIAAPREPSECRAGSARSSSAASPREPAARWPSMRRCSTRSIAPGGGRAGSRSRRGARGRGCGDRRRGRAPPPAAPWQPADHRSARVRREQRRHRDLAGRQDLRVRLGSRSDRDVPDLPLPRRPAASRARSRRRGLSFSRRGGPATARRCVVGHWDSGSAQIRDREASRSPMARRPTSAPGFQADDCGDAIAIAELRRLEGAARAAARRWRARQVLARSSSSGSRCRAAIVPASGSCSRAAHRRGGSSGQRRVRDRPRLARRPRSPAITRPSPVRSRPTAARSCSPRCEAARSSCSRSR